MKPIILDLTRIEAIALHEAVAAEEPDAWHGSYLAGLRDRLGALIVASDDAYARSVARHLNGCGDVPETGHDVLDRGHDADYDR